MIWFPLITGFNWGTKLKTFLFNSSEINSLKKLLLFKLLYSSLSTICKSKCCFNKWYIILRRNLLKFIIKILCMTSKKSTSLTSIAFVKNTSLIISFRPSLWIWIFCFNNFFNSKFSKIFLDKIDIIFLLFISSVSFNILNFI